jgi:predicted secreted protein
VNWLDFLAGTILAVVFVIFFAVLWFAIRDLREQEPVVTGTSEGDRLDRDFQLIEFLHALRKDAS